MAATRKINYPAGRAKPVKAAAPADQAKIKRALSVVVREYDAAAVKYYKATAVRDKAIRDAHAAGLPTKQIAELTGLTDKRIDQIRRGTRQ